MFDRNEDKRKFQGLLKVEKTFDCRFRAGSF